MGRGFIIMLAVAAALPAALPVQAQTGGACTLQYTRVCPGVAAGGPALQACLDKQGAALSPACRQSAGVPTVPLPAPTGELATPDVILAPTVKPKSAVAPSQLGFMCADDLIKLCPNVVKGLETGALDCLRRNIGKVSEPCALGLTAKAP